MATGYRVTETAPVVGETLEASYVWDGDEITTERLQGTCAFASLAAARAYGKYSHGYTISRIDGERVMAGELVNEIVLRDAVVVEVVEVIK